jgi:hypothetical protein
MASDILIFICVGDSAMEVSIFDPGGCENTVKDTSSKSPSQSDELQERKHLLV